MATRSSPLALAQARSVARAIGGAELVEIETDSEPGGRERSVRGVEQAVLEGRAGVGVHSAGDLPGRMTAGLAIAAVPCREDAREAWVGPGSSLGEVPPAARVGLVGLRRRSQLLALRPDLRTVELRGDVDSRIRKLREGEVDGLVLAMAGLKRLGREEEASFTFGLDQMLPCAGQGTLVVQSRSGEQGADGLPELDNLESQRRLLAERAAAFALEADRSGPVGIHARIDGDRLTVDGWVGLADGSQWIRDAVEGSASQPEAVGRELAKRMTSAGARELLDLAGGEIDT